MRSIGKTKRIVGLAAAVAAIGLPFAGTAVASADAAAPAVTATPATGLPATAEVSVAVTGFGANGTASVTECGGDTTTGAILCRVDGAASVSLDGTGAGSATLTVTSTFEGLDLVTGETRTIDCATVAGGCHIGVAQTEGGLFASTPISFS